jgi:phage shock protein PspC (stress-responsive transcriptional regulator)
MSTPYTPYSPKAPKRLLRSRSDRILGGVCGGTAAYLNMDPTLVRVLTALITLFTGVPIIVYLVMLFVVPEEGSQPPGGYPPVQPPPATQDHVWGAAGAPWEQPLPEPEPVRPADPQPAPENKPQDPRL